MQPAELLRYTPTLESRYNGLPPHGRTTLQIGEKRIYPFHETLDFKSNNPWSEFFRGALYDLSQRGVIGNGPVTELGVGDLRNRFAFNGIPSFTGIDVETERLDLALANQHAHGLDNITLYHGDAVALVKSRDKWNGTVVACLPQTPPTPEDAHSAVGTYNPNHPLIAEYKKWAPSGLQLVAASLGELSKRADDDLRAVVMIAGRVPEEERLRMIRETGWSTVETITTPEPIQQSQAVSLDYTKAFGEDRTDLFYEKPDARRPGFRPITPVQAESRRRAAFRSGDPDKKPNVYHDLHVYVLEKARAPKGGDVYVR